MFPTKTCQFFVFFVFFKNGIIMSKQYQQFLETTSHKGKKYRSSRKHCKQIKTSPLGLLLILLQKKMYTNTLRVLASLILWWKNCTSRVFDKKKGKERGTESGRKK